MALTWEYLIRFLSSFLEFSFSCCTSKWFSGSKVSSAFNREYLAIQWRLSMCTNISEFYLPWRQVPDLRSQFPLYRNKVVLYWISYYFKDKQVIDAVVYIICIACILHLLFHNITYFVILCLGPRGVYEYKLNERANDEFNCWMNYVYSTEVHFYKLFFRNEWTIICVRL